VYDFLLVINTTRTVIELQDLLAKNHKFFLPPLIQHPRSRWPPPNLWKSFLVPETKVFQAADGEDLVILACIVFDFIHPCDGRTDGRTELQRLRRAKAV